MSTGPAVMNKALKMTLFRATNIQGDPDAFRASMEKKPQMTIRWFNGGLRYLLELVSKNKRTMLHVTPTLTMFLQYYAKWISGQQFDAVETLYHVVCLSNYDHHKILELVIKELGLTLINARDVFGCTALMYAVQTANVKCVKKLIANRADVNLLSSENQYKFKYHIANKFRDWMNPLIDSIMLLHFKSLCSTNIMMDIFNLLLASGADVNARCHKYKRTPLMHAATVDNVYCVRKLIENGSDIFATDKTGQTTLMLAAGTGSLDVLKYLIEDVHLEKNSIHENGCSVLCFAVRSMNVKTVRYLLDLGVSTITNTPEERVEPCQHCSESLPYVYSDDFYLHPCMEAIESNTTDMVKLFEEYGCQSYKHLFALSQAVCLKRVEVVKYLLSNYNYQLNKEYKGSLLRWNPHATLLTEACDAKSIEIVNLLLEHGADPNVNNCVKTCSSALNVAIFKRLVEVIARLIRGGVNVNAKSFYPGIGAVLPFEAAVWHNHIYAAKMFFVYGSSCGMFNLPKKHKCKVGIAPGLQELLEEWNVHKNKVLSLQQRCRMVILNHLCPQADKKITELPLPPPLITFLNIPELDDIMAASKSNPQTNIQRKIYRFR